MVASPIANGTFRIRASVRASSVLPTPVGPIIITFDFSSSTASSLSAFFSFAVSRL